MTLEILVGYTKIPWLHFVYNNTVYSIDSLQPTYIWESTQIAVMRGTKL